jgi:glycosyltransferase involved in cell wall biosynthesis
VVIPCYDDGAFLRDAVASAREQAPGELVVVDDGSQDPKTLAVLDELRRGGVRVERQGNAGLAAARMRGVAVTTAPYVHPLDADDRLAPGALGVLARALDEHPDAAAAWGDVQTFGAAVSVHPKRRPLDGWRTTLLNEQPALALFRRSALEQVGGWSFDEAFEDWDLWMALAATGMPTVPVGRVTYFYREHDEPRMYRSALERHAELRAVLRARHPELFRARRRSRRRSPSSPVLKLAFTALSALPMSTLTRERLLGLVRDAIEPDMRSTCAPTAWQLVHRKLLAPRRTGAAGQRR